MITWWMIPEIWNAMHRIFCDFSPSFAFSPPEQPEKSKFRKKEKNTGRYHHFTLVYHKWWYIMIWYMIWYDIWYMIPEIWRVKGTFLVILDHFLLLYPPNNPENQHFGKMKKKPGDIIILCFCTINNNHMMYVYWDMECNRQMDGQSEGRTNGKSDIQRWVPYLKIIFKVGYTKVKLSLLSPN